MNETNNKSMAGGFFIALGLIGGGIAGVYFDQPSAGMVIGLGIGCGIALLVWLIDRKRGN
jgi:TM2 domain-containing membrane protein YozV